MGEIATPFIHFHIQKTGGTALEAGLIEHFGPEKVAEKQADGRLRRASEFQMPLTEFDQQHDEARRHGRLDGFILGLRQIDALNPPQTFPMSDIPVSGISLAMGHFRHQDISEEVAHLPRTTIVRDPLARMWSHFNHWRDERGIMWWNTSSVPYSGDVSFEEFATDPNLANFQAEILGNLEFDVVGVSTDLNGFLGRLGIRDVSVPTLNIGLHNGMPNLDPGFLRDFRDLHSRDYELVEAATSGQPTLV